MYLAELGFTRIYLTVLGIYWPYQSLLDQAVLGWNWLYFSVLGCSWLYWSGLVMLDQYWRVWSNFEHSNLKVADGFEWDIRSISRSPGGDKNGWSWWSQSLVTSVWEKVNLVSSRECPLGILNLHPQLLDGPHVLPSLFYKQKKWRMILFRCASISRRALILHNPH